MKISVHRFRPFGIGVWLVVKRQGYGLTVGRVYKDTQNSKLTLYNSHSGTPGWFLGLGWRLRGLQTYQVQKWVNFKKGLTNE